jgi:hypothetical protein
MSTGDSTFDLPTSKQPPLRVIQHEESVRLVEPSISDQLQFKVKRIDPMEMKVQKIDSKLLVLNKECLRLRVKVLKLERELARPSQIVKFIDIKNRAPRALEKHTLPEEIKLKQSLREETQKLNMVERQIEMLESVKSNQQDLERMTLKDIV